MKIDLGMSYGSSPRLSDADDEHYPTLTYEGPQDLDLPESGVMKIRFKKIRKSESIENGVERHTCTIEAREILSVKGEKAEAEEDMPAKSRDEASGALDKLMADKMRSKKY